MQGAVSDANPPHKSGPDNNTPYWANNSMTGYCGQVDGGYVVAAQLFLYAREIYAGPIDNYWGSRSHSALIAYQRERGSLQVDGCAGPATWADMQARTRYIGTSTNCYGAPGELDVYGFANGSRWAHFTRSSGTDYWYSQTWSQPLGGPLREGLYRFSDGLVVRC